jgi:hypothetical protein
MDSTVDDLTTDVIESCESRELDHLGLVPGTSDELADRCVLVQNHERGKVSEKLRGTL